MDLLVRRLQIFARGGSGPVNDACSQAADEIERLRAAMKEACDLLAERAYGSPARSPAHNARLRLEAAMAG